jgi:5-methylcytosine-specific restriction endonuclease McrA
MENHLCDYGCGEKAKYFFKNGKKCCSKYIFGCQNRKYNNKAWNKGLTKETDERVKKCAANMKKTKTKGFYEAWNKGLTKETDERVKQYGKKGSKSKKGIPNYKKRKDITTCITASEFRYYIKTRLYTSWVFPILKRDNFTCQKCGKKKNLEVHHLKPFRKIFLECIEMCKLDINNYSNWKDVDIILLEKNIITSHKIKNGITLCKNCHGDADEYRKQFFDNKG